MAVVHLLKQGTASIQNSSPWPFSRGWPQPSHSAPAMSSLLLTPLPSPPCPAIFLHPGDVFVTILYCCWHQNFYCGMGTWCPFGNANLGCKSFGEGKWRELSQELKRLIFSCCQNWDFWVKAWGTERRAAMCQTRQGCRDGAAAEWLHAERLMLLEDTLCWHCLRSWKLFQQSSAGSVFLHTLDSLHFFPSSKTQRVSWHS